MDIKKFKQAILDGNFLLAKKYIAIKDYEQLESLLMDMGGLILITSPLTFSFFT